MDLFRHADDATPFASGAVIFQEGDAGAEMYVILEGEVELLVHGQVVDTLKRDAIFGEMALIDSSPRSATAIAKTDCKIVKIDQKRFMFLVQQTPFFAIEVMRTLAARLRRMDERL